MTDWAQPRAAALAGYAKGVQPMLELKPEDPHTRWWSVSPTGSWRPGT